MRTLLVAFALAFFAGILFTWIIRHLAIRWKLYDDPVGGRKIHQRPIPRLGGIAVALAFSVPVIALALWSNDISAALYTEPGLLISLLGGGSLVLTLGIHDDLVGSGALIKLIGQVTAAMVVFHAGVQINVISVPFMAPMVLGIWAFPVTIFWIVLVTNAINLIDGLDGLAAGVAVLAGSTLAIMSLVENDIVGALLLVSMVGATLGFLRFNWNPASIFLGDTGSLFLGFLLAIVSAHSSQKSFALFSIVAAFVALALPIFDLSMAVIRRFLMGKPIFSADQYHVHHLLLRKGLSQRQAAVLLLGGATFLGVASLIFIYSSDKISAITILVLVVLIGLAIRFLGYTDIIRAGRKTMMFGQLEEDARVRSLSINNLRATMLKTEDEQTMWRALLQAGEILALEEIALQVLSQGDAGIERKARSWHRHDPDGKSDVQIQTLVRAEYPVQLGRVVFGSITLSWLRENSIFDPHQHALGHILADAVAHAMFTQRGMDGLHEPERHVSG
jgi:UDP-GlcNAc:undecaprenyl-phosphate GlcNAc-1-phosphate transferase